MSGFIKAFQKVPNFGARPSSIEKDNQPETSAEAAQSEGEPLAMKGYIEKRGGPTNPAYKSRYLTLTKFGNVRYFKDQKNTAKLGCFKVGATTEFEAFGEKELRVITDERIWEFRFINVEVRAAWYLAFQEVINELYIWDNDENCDTAHVLAVLRQQYSELSLRNQQLDVKKAEKNVRASMTNRNSITGSLLAKVRNGENNNNCTIQKLLEIQTQEVPRVNGASKVPINILCMTWNLAEYLPDLKELDFLRDKVSSEERMDSELPSLVVVSVQECQSLLYNVTDSNINDLAPVELWRTMVQSVLGRHYTIAANRTMGAIQCTVYCRVNIIHSISHMSLGHVACGIGNFMQNKGGVAISFRMHGTSIAFVGAHLPAHQKNVLDRNAAYHRIDQLLVPLLTKAVAVPAGGDEANSPTINSTPQFHASTSPIRHTAARASMIMESFLEPTGNHPNLHTNLLPKLHQESSLCTSFDHVFFMGDFNYRADCNNLQRFMDSLCQLETLERSMAGDARPIIAPVVSGESVDKKLKSRRLTMLSISTLIESNRSKALTWAGNGNADDEKEEEEDVTINKERSNSGGSSGGNGWAMDVEEDALFKRFQARPVSNGTSTGNSVLLREQMKSDHQLHKDIVTKLLKVDQLQVEMVKGTAFTGFQEPPVTFRPSYKFAVDSEHYSCTVQAGKAKSRMPAWCDRILYKKNAVGLTVKSYECIHGKFHSDHRAIVAEFVIEV